MHIRRACQAVWIPDMPIKVSVLILAYNHEGTVAQAVESALEQRTNFDVEIVIGEDCSTDRTRDVLRELARREPQRVRLLLREANLGVGENLRQTLAACRGEFVALLEGDDYWTEPAKLQRQVEALAAHPHWSICFHRARVEFDNGSPPALEPADDHFTVETGLDDLLCRNYMATASVMFRNGLFREWPERFRRLVQQDWPLHVLNAQHGRIGYLPAVMGVYRKHAGGVWASRPQAERYQLLMDAYDAFEDVLGDAHRQAVRTGRRQLVQHLAEQLQSAVRSREYRWGKALLRPIRAVRRRLRPGGPSPPPITP